MFNKIRILLAVGFILSLSWDLLLHIIGDLSFLGGVSSYSYLGDIRVPRGLIVGSWILEITIMILGSYSILTMDFRKFIPKRFSKINDQIIPLKYACWHCGNKYLQFANSINIKKSELSAYCIGCGSVQGIEEIIIESVHPFIYKNKKVIPNQTITNESNKKAS